MVHTRHKIHPAHFTKVKGVITVLLLLSSVHWAFGIASGVVWLWICEEEDVELV